MSGLDRDEPYQGTTDAYRGYGPLEPTLPSVSDYADEIARDTVDANIYALSVQYGQVRNWDLVERMLAQAAREGYALAMGVKS